MSLRKGLTHYYRYFGIRGVLAIFANRILGQPKEITAHPPAIRNPVRLRIRTSDQFLYAEILLQGQYAFDLPFSPKTIVDAGANIGMASIYFAHRYPEAKIIAIEAEASNFAMLARNVRPYATIIPLHAALWNRDGEISVSEPDPSTGASGKWAFVTHEGPGVKVRAVTMRTLMKEMEMHCIDLLKIDIEGAEKEVFEACDWIDDIRCLMIELHDRLKPGCSEAVNSVARAFTKLRRVETTLYVRDA
jgi:FkbM family methyltransferase